MIVLDVLLIESYVLSKTPLMKTILYSYIIRTIPNEPLYNVTYVDNFRGYRYLESLKP